MRTIRIQILRGTALLLCVLLGACTTTASLVLGVAGLAVDISPTWEIAKHLHAKLIESDDLPCTQLDSVQRALNVRCGAFVPGSLRVADIQRSPLQGCALAVAAREPRFWPVLPELIDKGAQPGRCDVAPIVELARQPGCPDFAAAAPAELGSLRWLAQSDARAVDPDVLRMFSCPNARRAGLDAVLDAWLASGELERGRLGFGAFGALHPTHLASPLAVALEARGHTARASLGASDAVQPRGFEEALRTSDWAALDWWLSRVPELANRVAPTQGNQLSWVPLARVLVPNFLADASSQGAMVEFLMSRGADPNQKLPFDKGRTVVAHARELKSPMLALLERGPLQAGPGERQPAAVVMAAVRP